MTRSQSASRRSTSHAAGPRAVLRVPDVLLALTGERGRKTLAELSVQLDVPKTSLHRLLRTLELGGYLARDGGAYVLGPASFHPARSIAKSAPPAVFPTCARPVLEWLARESGETVMLGVLIEQSTEIVYVDVIDSQSPVRFTVPVGDRRPLYCAASGKAVLAFLPSQVQSAYIARTNFVQFTPHTTRKADVPRILRRVQQHGASFDRSGKVVGASGIASPIFDRDGNAIASVSVAGPTDRIQAQRAHLEALVRSAGERISRAMGYSDPYPRAVGSKRA